MLARIRCPESARPGEPSESSNFFSAVGKLAITILAAQLFKGHAAAGKMAGFSILSLSAVGIFVIALGMGAWSARTVWIPPYRSHDAFGLRNARKAFLTERQLRLALMALSDQRGIG